MRPKPSNAKKPAEQVVKDIRRATPRHFSAEDNIRIVLDGLRGEDSIAELCRKEGIAQSLPTLCPVRDAVETLASTGIEERRAIFTRQEVVDFILDLVGCLFQQAIAISRFSFCPNISALQRK